VHLERPIDRQPHYGEHLGDPGYWAPYVREVLERHGLPVERLEAPHVGTFPTFIVGDLVVKLFGPGFDGERSSQVETAMHDLLESHAAIPSAGLVATGQLFELKPAWPYLVAERVRGRAIRDVNLSDTLAEGVAAELGAIVGSLHALTPPAIVASRDLLDGLRDTAADRLRRFGLPEHLVEQVPRYLTDAEPALILVHGDITADHVFVDQKGVTAVIDWGDALVADRAYELPAVYFDALGGDRRLLAAFLDAADWPQADLPRRGMQGVLEFQFDAISGIANRFDLARIETLDHLATRLFAIPSSNRRCS
jgi:hypothetical protein